MASARTWVAGARPRTLPAAVVPVAVGTACAVGVTAGGLIWWRAAAALVVSLALQVGTNFANDYSDGIRGTDDDTKRVGPVRLVGQRLAEPRSVKLAAFASFGVAGVAGLALAVAVGWQLLVVGALAIAAGWFYTGGPRPYGYAQVEHLTALGLGASVPVGMLATALLVVNNLRDIPGDTEVGKNTLAVRLGDRRTRALYVTLVGGSLVGGVLVAVLGHRPWALLAVAGVVAAVRPIRAVLAGARGRDLIAVLADTGRLQLVFGALFTLGLALSG